MESSFDEALRLVGSAEREAYLDRACAGNQGLRQEVAALLSAHAQAGDFLGLRPASSPCYSLAFPTASLPITS